MGPDWQRGGRCPGTDALSAISDKWKAAIVVRLSHAGEPVRFAHLQRALAPVSRKVLAAALHELERDGIVTRSVYAEVPPRVEYALTDRGRALMPILRSLHAWQLASVDEKHGLTT